MRFSRSRKFHLSSTVKTIDNFQNNGKQVIALYHLTFPLFLRLSVSALFFILLSMLVPFSMQWVKTWSYKAVYTWEIFQPESLDTIWSGLFPVWNFLKQAITSYPRFLYFILPFQLPFHFQIAVTNLFLHYVEILFSKFLPGVFLLFQRLAYHFPRRSSSLFSLRSHHRVLSLYFFIHLTLKICTVRETVICTFYFIDLR